MVAPVTRATQTLLLTVTGVVLLRMSIGDTYLNYVNAWMRWPLIASGALLIGLGLLELWRADDAHDGEHDGEHAADHDSGSHVPRAAWLLFAPSLVFFLVAPPALGAYFAERAETVAVTEPDVGDGGLPALPDTDPVPLAIDEVLMRAFFDDGATMAERRIEVTGFVSHDDSGWYVTQFSMNCCAADAFVMRVRASGADAPPDDQWVTVVGTHVAGTGMDGEGDPEITVESVTETAAPKNQYR